MKPGGSECPEVQTEAGPGVCLTQNVARVTFMCSLSCDICGLQTPVRLKNMDKKTLFKWQALSGISKCCSLKSHAL